MTIAATQASLRLAQGAGRLIRTATDKGVVAVLDSRLANARYGSFVKASLPPMWSTTDGELVRASLRGIDAAAPDPLPVSAAILVGAATSGRQPDKSDADESDRHRKRWSDQDEQLLVDSFSSGTPLTLLADELGRTRGAIVSRLRSKAMFASVHLVDRETATDDDKALAYELAQAPPPALADLAALADAMSVDGWTVEPDGDDALRLARGAVDALVAIGAAEPLLLGDATSRWLISGAADIPAGVTGLVVPRTD